MLAALPRGGVPAWAQAAGCAACGLACALAALGAQALLLPLAALPLALVAGFAALQCLPLPAGLVRAIAPASWDLRTLPPAPVTTVAPLSLDAPATLAALALPVACALACVAAVLLSRGRTRRAVCAIPAAAAAVQALVCVANLALGVRTALGAPADAQGAQHAAQLVGSFVNRNHQAALLVLGALVALGGFLHAPANRRRPPDPLRAALGVVAVVCAAAALLSLSRGGVLGLVVGVALLALLRRRSGQRARLRAVALAVALVAALALGLSADALFFAARRLTPGALSTDLKLRSFAGAAQVALDHWAVGVGRGAWRFVAERHRNIPGEYELVFVENEPLQLAAELGLPAALAILALLGASLWRAARRSPPEPAGVARPEEREAAREAARAQAAEGLRLGCLAGLGALAVHNLVDFNLELLGVALPAAVALGASCAPLPPFKPGARRAPALRAALAAGALAAAALACLALRAGTAQSAASEDARLRALARDPSTSPDAVEAAAREVARRHPADWLASLLAADALEAARPPLPRRALPWVNRALAIAPTSWRAHRAAAGALLLLGARAQARLETRVAFEGHNFTVPPGPLLELVAAAARGEAELLEATPEEAAVRVQLVGLLRGRGRAAEARALAEHELARLDADTPPGYLGGAGDPRAGLLVELAHLAQGAHDTAAAAGFAARLAALDPDSCVAPLLSAEASAAGGEQDLEAPLRVALARCPGDAGLVRALVQARRRRGDTAGALRAFLESGAESQTSGWATEAHLLHAELLEAAGRGAEGLAQRWIAAELAPDNADLGLDYANRLAARGSAAAAVEALRSLSRQAGEPARARLEARSRELEGGSQRGEP